MEIRPVAHIHNGFSEKFGIPRQSGRAPGVISTVVFEPEYRSPDALREIEGFSHLWLIFDFSEAHRAGFTPTVRPPRLGGNRRVGVFASRSPFRPNNLGLSAVRLLRTEVTANDGTVLIVSGADLLDGTPIYDVKPYLPFADSIPDARGGYADEFVSHQLTVSDPGGLLGTLPGALRAAVTDCIADDPRPSYQNDPERVYTMAHSGVEISFRVDGDAAEITEIRWEEES